MRSLKAASFPIPLNLKNDLIECFIVMIVSCGWFIALCSGLIVSIWMFFKIGYKGIDVYGVTNEPDVIMGFLVLMALVLGYRTSWRENATKS